MNEYEDREITCIEPGCGPFTWTVKDQEFYAEKGFTAPKRCREHAKARRAFFDSHPEKTQPRQKSKRRGDREEFE